MPLDIATLSRYRMERAKEDAENQIRQAEEFIKATESYLDNKLEEES